MHKIVIADTSCLIVLSKIKLLHALQALYSEVIITPEVANEFGEALPEWLVVKEAKPENILIFQNYNLGAGEITSLALAIELNNIAIILDDEKAKKIARSYHLNVTGTLGIIIKAKENGIIENVADALTQIKNTNFHLPSSLEHLILQLAGELNSEDNNANK
jgi:predicted nucleic acid-binding protein